MEILDDKIQKRRGEKVMIRYGEIQPILCIQPIYIYI